MTSRHKAGVGEYTSAHLLCMVKTCLRVHVSVRPSQNVQVSLTCYFVLAASLVDAIGAKFGAVEVEITISSADELIGAHNSLALIAPMARITSNFLSAFARGAQGRNSKSLA